MNKKITIIELLNKIVNGEDLPKRIKIQEYVFELSKDYEHYYYNEDVEITHLINHNFSNLTDEVEILEDNTEEIEEYKGESFEQLGYEIGKMSTAIVRGLIKAVNEMKEESEDEQ